jgi:meso-butanediol dehydrogenase/(S,S)-butanediol dehydrogenase/diacetyl reductase
LNVNLSGKIGIITGAATTLGRAISLSLAKSGLAVACLDSNLSEGELTASLIVNSGGSALPFSYESGNEESIDDAIKDACDKMGTPSILCNAEDYGRYSHTTDQDASVLNKIISSNLVTPLLATKAAMPHLLATGGTVVNVVSSAGLRAVPFAAAYCASQAGLVMMTKSLALEYLERGVRVNAIAVSGIDSLFTPEKGFPAGMAPKWLEQMKSPLGEIKAEYIAETVKFLVSENAKFITGAVISVDGGVSVQ